MCPLCGARQTRPLPDSDAPEAESRAGTKKTAGKPGRTLAGLAAAAVVCLALYFLAAKVVIPAGRYSRAKTLLDAGQYQEAITAFADLGDYRDSSAQIAAAREARAEIERRAAQARQEAEQQAQEARLAAEREAEAQRLAAEREAEAERLEALRKEQAALDEQNGRYRSGSFDKAGIGDTVFFGVWEQNGEPSDGAEEIEWLVLDKANGRLLVVSRYALDCRPYHTERAAVTWETCSLRAWLNGEFMFGAFSAGELEQIPVTPVSADANPGGGADPGSETRDRIFLLSVAEIYRYFPSLESKSCALTSYAAEKADGDGCRWWLRTPGGSAESAVSIASGGAENLAGTPVELITGAVRPAMWIELAPASEESATPADENEPEAGTGQPETVGAAAAVSAFRGADYASAQPGDFVTFGVYEQDGDLSDGAEPIEWQVLDRREGRLLLVSRFALDCRPYNADEAFVTWETCTLRDWLNWEFPLSAFSGPEQARIPTVTVRADKNPNYKTNPGNDTLDRVFLLSFPEVRDNYASVLTAACAPTAYAREQGVDALSGGNCWWWLRTPGFHPTYAAGVYSGGAPFDYGYVVNSRTIAVRPALWLDLGA